MKTYIPWNKGLTKEMDSRLLHVSEAVSCARKGVKHTQEHRMKNSLAHKGQSARGISKLPKGDIRRHEATLKGWIKRRQNGKGTWKGKFKGRIPWNKNKKAEDDPRILTGKKNIFGRRKFIGHENGFFGKHHTPETLKKIFKNRKNLKPTVPERKLFEILNAIYPNEYRYTGNWEIIIGRMCPDFTNVNGRKEVIELYGDYWHRGENPQTRIDKFAEFGFKCLIIWQYELKEREKVIQRIQQWRSKNEILLPTL